MTTRAQVTAALSGIADVTGHDYRPAAPRPGDGWSLHQGYVRHEESGQFYANWRVQIMLPADDRAASRWMDDHVDEIADGLAPVGYILSILPVELSVAGAAAGILALEVTMRTE